MILRLYYQGPSYSRIDRALLFKYMAAGFFTSLSDYVAFTICFSFINTGLLAATVVAYIIGLVVSYLLNRYWVFHKGADRQSDFTNVWRYILFLIINLIITYAMLWAMQEWLHITPYIGKLVVNVFMFFWIYWGDTYFVFAGEKVGPIKL